MAKKFLTSINLSGNEIQNVRIHVLGSDPGSPAEGQMWYNSTAKVLKYRTNNATILIGTGGTSDDSLLLESHNAAFFQARANHTGTQTSSTISDFTSATNTLISAAVSSLVDSAPGTLDTLNELAAALGDDPNFATSMTNAIAAKTGKYTVSVGDGTATSIAVTHGLNSRAASVQVFDATTYETVECDVSRTSVNMVTLGFAVAPTSNSLTVVVVA